MMFYSGLYQFDKLKEVASEKGPKFVFSHMGLPHPPFLLNEKGEFHGKTDRKTVQFNVPNYLAHLKLTNEKLEELFDVIYPSLAPNPSSSFTRTKGQRSWASGVQ